MRPEPFDKLTTAHIPADTAVEENDSEVSWKGEGRSGQVAIRNECGEDDKIYVKITNRPV